MEDGPRCQNHYEERNTTMKHVRFVTIQSETLPRTASSLEVAQKAAIAVSFATAISTLATAFNTLANGFNTLAHKQP